MPTFLENQQQAADWMFERRAQVGWWRWSVLTQFNNDPASLHLEPQEAVLIFADLVHRGLLVPVVAPDGGDAFTINPARENEWHALTHPAWTAFRGYGATLVGHIISGIIGALIGFAVAALLGL